jgi:glutathione peroxidase
VAAVAFIVLLPAAEKFDTFPVDANAARKILFDRSAAVFARLIVFVLFCLLFVGASLPLPQEKKGAKKVPAVLQFEMNDIDGKKVNLSRYQGKVVLIVNVASECGYTPQYKDLQALHAKYAKDGLAILGFPCNDFGGQEPGDDAAVKEFACKTYKVEFDLFSKVKITGKDACPLYRFLTSKQTNPKHAGAVQWNFEKFLIARDGSVAARFASDVDPAGEEFVGAIMRELRK